MSRVSAAQRAKSSLIAEREIMRFALPDPATGIRPHALWHKYVHNVELDPVQDPQDAGDGPAPAKWNGIKTISGKTVNEYFAFTLIFVPSGECTHIIAPFLMSCLCAKSG